ncbi:MAG: BadF/BadG/BcrA/BcrD ATPase family protein [Chloroflexota bacterium]
MGPTPRRRIQVLGLDGGATRTVCLIVDEAGVEMGRGTAGPSNHQAVGVEAARQALEQALAAARRAAGDPPLAAACFGMAGLDREEDRRILDEMAASLLPGVPVEVVHDADIALVAGTEGKRAGVVVIAGTGSIAVGYDAAGRMARAGGWGHLLGDEGSGYDLARRGLNAATRALDGRGPATVLAERLPVAVDTASMETLADRVYLEAWTPAQVAALAPVVLAAAQEGDEVAGRIVDGGAEELALAAQTVIRALGMEERAFEVVLSGGIFQGSPRMVERIRRQLAVWTPQAAVILPRQEPVWGAAWLALRRVKGSGGSSP